MISVRQAAEFLGLDVQTVRLLLQSGQVPWGQAVKISNHHIYLIYNEKFAELTGYKCKEKGGEISNG